MRWALLLFSFLHGVGVRCVALSGVFFFFFFFSISTAVGTPASACDVRFGVGDVCLTHSCP